VVIRYELMITCNNVMLLSGRITPRHSNSYTTRLFLKVSASATVIHKQVAIQDLAVQVYIHQQYTSSILLAVYRLNILAFLLPLVLVYSVPTVARKQVYSACIFNSGIHNSIHYHIS
jgi:hypothetical protein